MTDTDRTSLAFGLFARVLPSAPQYATVRTGTAGLELADSIASDAHKLLNVPYDCGFFFCRHLDIPSQVFANTNAAYLSNGPSGDSIPSSLNLRLENSARFRGLPVYATLLAYGRGGYAEMIARMTDVAREVAQFIKDDCPHLELLPNGVYDDNLKSMFMIVLFRAKDEALNEVLVKRIKQSGKVYASGTKWAGRSAVRFAIAKWDIDVDRDVRVAKSLLNSLA